MDKPAALNAVDASLQYADMDVAIGDVGRGRACDGEWVPDMHDDVDNPGVRENAAPLCGGMGVFSSSKPVDVY